MWYAFKLGNATFYGIQRPVPTEYSHRENLRHFVFKYANYLVPSELLTECPDYNNPDLLQELNQFPVRSGIIIIPTPQHKEEALHEVY